MDYRGETTEGTAARSFFIGWERDKRIIGLETPGERTKYWTIPSRSDLEDIIDKFLDILKDWRDGDPSLN